MVQRECGVLSEVLPENRPRVALVISTEEWQTRKD